MSEGNYYYLKRGENHMMCRYEWDECWVVWGQDYGGEDGVFLAFAYFASNEWK
jgi:hypothetical protein